MPNDLHSAPLAARSWIDAEEPMLVKETQTFKAAPPVSVSEEAKKSQTAINQSQKIENPTPTKTVNFNIPGQVANQSPGIATAGIGNISMPQVAKYGSIILGCVIVFNVLIGNKPKADK